MKSLFVSALITLFSSTAFSQQSVADESVFLHRAQNALTTVLIADKFSLPVSIRIYTYSNIAAHEVLAAGNRGFVSLYTSDNRFPDLSPLTAPANVHLPLAAVYAYLLTGKNFVYHEQQLNDSLISILQDFRLPGSDYTRVQASLDYGTKIAEAIYAWSKGDNYRQIRSYPTYVVLNTPGKWTPTPPFKTPALEPLWGKMRCLVMDSAAQFHPAEPLAYDENNSSDFFKQAKQVHQAVKNISATEKATIAYWNDEHTIAAKWLSIAGSLCKQYKQDVYQTSRTFTMTTLALYDGVISCWDEKYRSNYIRPETFIRAKIDKSWNPYLKSPSVPEYTSDMAVLSEAVAAVLTSLYGDQKPFTDQSKPYTSRTFSSFQAAAVEAASTDFTSGVSFPRSVQNGREQGFQIGSLLVRKHRLALFAHN